MLGRGGREVVEDGKEQEEVELFDEGRRKPRKERTVGLDGFQSWEPRGAGSGRECSGWRWRSRGGEEEGGEVVGMRRARRRS